MFGYDRYKPQARDIRVSPSYEAYFKTIVYNVLSLSDGISVEKPDLQLRAGLLSSMLKGTLHSDYPTQKEACVQKEVLSKKDGSVRLDELFLIAFECSNKDYFTSLRTTYNLLEDGCFRKDRDELPLQKKIVKIREGNNFGLFYHFYGTALFSLLTGYPAGTTLMFAFNDMERKKDYDAVKIMANSMGLLLGSLIEDRI